MEQEHISPPEIKSASQKPPAPSGSSRSKKAAQKDIYNERNNKPEVPDCDCFSTDKKPPEPGSYYTHLGKKAMKWNRTKNLQSIFLDDK